MKKILISLIIGLLIATYSLGQIRQRINFNDSTELILFAKKFKDAVSKHDTIELKKMSLERIACAPCTWANAASSGSLITIDNFINQTYKDFKKSKLWDCVTNEQPMLNQLKPTGIFEQKEFKDNREIVIYELFYVTTKPNEIELGHEGQQTGLQFIKLNNGFKFYGLTTVP